MDPLISVIVPNYQGKDIFASCIESLLAQDYPNLQIVFVDDSSTDGSFEHAKKLFGNNKKVFIVQTPRNSGFVGACNYAYRFCKGKYIIPGNNDVTFPTNWISEMYRTVKGRKAIGASALLTSTKDKRIANMWRKGEYGTQTLVLTDVYRKLTPQEKETGFVEMPAAGCLIIPRAALKGHIFEKDYFAYGEDINCCWRSRLQGYSIISNLNALAYTESGYTRKKVPSFNRRATYFGTRNMIINFLVFYETKNVIRLIIPFYFVQLGVLLANPKAIPLRLKAHFWVLFHLRDVLRRRGRMQRARAIDDRELMRLLSYKLFDERLATTTHAKLITRFANFCMRNYCRLVGIRTFDMKDAAPQVKV